MSTNESMPEYVLNLLYRLAAERDLEATPHTVMFFGGTYKANVLDIRESPYFAILDIADCIFPVWDRLIQGMYTKPLDEALVGRQIAVILINHSGIDYQKIIDSVDLVIDCCNATKGLDEKGKVYLLGRGF
jgi:UDP-N-acetyl-D-mannosaminuronate dehydrogenase